MNVNGNQITVKHIKALIKIDRITSIIAKDKNFYWPETLIIVHIRIVNSVFTWLTNFYQ